MKKLSLMAALVSILFISCSSYGVKNEVNKSGQIKKLEKVGVIIRIPQSSILTHAEILLSIQKWSGAYKEIKELVYLSPEDVSNEISMYNAGLGRFAQLDESKSFMKFKTVGVVNMFFRVHGEELKKLMEKKGLTGLIIFEVDGFYSHELQYINTYSVTAVADAEFNLLFLDRQSKSKDVNELVGDKVRAILLNDIGGRFVTVLIDMDCLGN